MNDHREEALFEHCLGLPPEEREAYLREQCPDDPALVESVMNLLESHDAAGKFLEELPTQDSYEVASRLGRMAPSEESPGDQIGRYRLLELIGEGAWGTVWIARQTEDIDRQVAIKILKVGMDTKDFLARFEAERQMLAMMDHPNIAKVLDAGSTEKGRPYLVMELVKGIQILEFADKNRLGIRERVKLFTKVCRALHHAHRKGVVHRDLKPSNILVSSQYDEALPKVIDFGVAKSNQFRGFGGELYTSMHAFIGTPVYSSPEQLEFTGRDVDARSDIYSLGALLYELLCGATPFDGGKASEDGMAEFVRQVREEYAARPSQRFASLPEIDRENIATKRGLSPGKLESLLKGDLDWIVLKCLEKDPSRRYETARDLANDLRAFLDDRMVEASSPSPWRKLRKTVSGKRPAYAVWVEMAAVLVVAFVAVYYLGTRQSVDRDTTPLEIAPDSSIQLTDKSIAVLPLENMSPDPENAFFADGVHEDIINNLSKVNELFVIGRTSTLQFRNTKDSLRQIGNQLGVRYLVEGSVRRAGAKVRVTVQLIDSDTEGPLWADSFNRSLDDTFAIQAEIAKSIAEQLEATLSSEELRQIDYRPTTNQKAYDLFVRFRNRDAGQRLTLEEGIALLEQAVVLDPEFGAAWADLAIECSFLWKVGKHRNDPMLIERARIAMKQAEKWGDGMAFVPYAKSSLVWNESEDLEAAIDLLLEAVAISPTHEFVRRNLGRRYYDLGRLNEAEHHLEEAVRLNPLHSGHDNYLFQIYHLQKKWGEAEALVEKNLQRNPGEPEWLWKRVLLNYSRTGNRDTLVQSINADPQRFRSEPIDRLRSALVTRDLEKALRWEEEVGGRRFLYIFSEWGSFILRSRDLGIALIWFQLDESEEWRNAAAEAQAYLEEIIQNDPLPSPSLFASLAACHALLGDSKRMEVLIAKARDEVGRRQVSNSQRSDTEITIAIAYLVQGDDEKALETLEDLSKSGNPVMLNRVLDLWFIFDRFKGNPSYEALLGEDEGIRPKAEFSNTQRDDLPIPDSKSIAILPFENISGREEDEPFANGIHSTLLTQVSQVRDLKPTSRSSVLTYRGTSKRLTQIANELNVANVLTGDVQVIGRNLRINIQLTDAATDSMLWGRTYDRELTAENFFSIQSEITQLVAESLNAILTTEERERLEELPTRNTAALEAFLEARAIVDSTIQTRRQESIVLLERAIGLDPTFVQAYLYLARAHFSEPPVSGRYQNWRVESAANAESAVNVAISLDDRLADAHMLKGKVHAWRYQFGGDPFTRILEKKANELELAKRSLDRVLDLNPSHAEAYHEYGKLLREEFNKGGKRDPSIERIALLWLRKAVELDPRNPPFRVSLGMLLQGLGEYDEARKQFESALRIDPQYGHVYYALGNLLKEAFAAYDETIALSRRAITIDPARLVPHRLLLVSYWNLGDYREAYRWQKASIGAGLSFNKGGKGDQAASRSMAAFLRGNHEEFVEQLRIAVREIPNHSTLRRRLLNEDIREGRFQLALDRYETFFPYFFQEDVSIDQDLYTGDPGGMHRDNQAQAVMEIAEVLIHLGDTDRAYYLLDRGWDVYKEYPKRMGWNAVTTTGYGVRDAVRFALRGEKKEALRCIREAVDEGFRDRLELESTHFDSIREEPEFKASMAIVEADWARQLANVRRMEVNGELAPIPDEPRYQLDTPAKILVNQ